MAERRHDRAGQELVDGILTDLQERGLVLGPDELVLLHLAADAADLVVACKRRVSRDGMLLTNPKTGVTKSHPLLVTQRLAAADVARLLHRIDLSVPKPTAKLTPAAQYRHDVKSRAGKLGVQAQQRASR